MVNEHDFCELIRESKEKSQIVFKKSFHYFIKEWLTGFYRVQVKIASKRLRLVFVSVFFSLSC